MLIFGALSDEIIKTMLFCWVAINKLRNHRITAFNVLVYRSLYGCEVFFRVCFLCLYMIEYFRVLNAIFRALPLRIPEPRKVIVDRNPMIGLLSGPLNGSGS